jgi:hypothetical protein
MVARTAASTLGSCADAEKCTPHLIGCSITVLAMRVCPRRRLYEGKGQRAEAEGIAQASPRRWAQHRR